MSNKISEYRNNQDKYDALRFYGSSLRFYSATVLNRKFFENRFRSAIKHVWSTMFSKNVVYRHLQKFRTFTFLNTISNNTNDY